MKPATKNALQLAAILAAVALAVCVGLLYRFSEPPGVIKDHAGCTVKTCGPLVFEDCNAVLDGPLRVYTRLPHRFLEDCSYWRMGKPFCRGVVKLRNYCPA